MQYMLECRGCRKMVKLPRASFKRHFYAETLPLCRECSRVRTVMVDWDRWDKEVFEVITELERGKHHEQRGKGCQAKGHGSQSR